MHCHSHRSMHLNWSLSLSSGIKNDGCIGTLGGFTMYCGCFLSSGHPSISTCVRCSCHLEPAPYLSCAFPTYPILAPLLPLPTHAILERNRAPGQPPSPNAPSRFSTAAAPLHPRPQATAVCSRRSQHLHIALWWSSHLCSYRSGWASFRGWDRCWDLCSFAGWIRELFDFFHMFGVEGLLALCRYYCFEWVFLGIWECQAWMTIGQVCLGCARDVSREACAASGGAVGVLLCIWWGLSPFLSGLCLWRSLHCRSPINCRVHARPRSC